MSQSKSSFVGFLQQYSIPLLLGVVAAVVVANVDVEWYRALIEKDLGFSIFGHGVTPHFLINDVFMVFFFAVATKEIVESVMPGGALNPPSKALNPIFGTIGGIAGPIGMYFLLAWLFYGSNPEEFAIVKNGWAIPTATDIALAWVTARVVFGATHPAVNFLLLLAIADDGIGLAIIAIFYPDPNHPVKIAMLGLVALGMLVAWLLRKKGVRSWVPYVAIGGTLSWLGLLTAAIHPALALVPIVPFLPGPAPRDYSEPAAVGPAHGDPLNNFEHAIKLPVDFGLFFFGFANAGVEFSSVNETTWVVLFALLAGKTIGIGGFAWFADKIGFHYPTGMGTRHVFAAGVVGAMGLTVALFVTEQAFPMSMADHAIFNGPAKMGALMSAGTFFVAFVVGKLLNVKHLKESRE